jgi:hypothetical protein
MNTKPSAGPPMGGNHFFARRKCRALLVPGWEREDVALDPKDKHQSSDNIERMGQDADALILAGKRLAEELRALAERAQKIAAQVIGWRELRL